jgi:general secretion pathway protein K
MGAEALAKRVLFTTFQDEPNATHLDQLWAQGETSYPVDYGTITGEILDLQACFNLNALRPNSNTDNNDNDNNDNNNNNNDRNTSPANNSSSETNNKEKTTAASTGSNANTNTSTQENLSARDTLERLIVALDLEGVNDFSAESMVDALTDWLDEDDAIVSPSGAEDNDYAAREFPYLTANNYLASINELRLIEHFTLPVINALKDYVCVLPSNDLFKINVNTLTTEKAKLLEAILEISAGDAEQILSARDTKGFKNIEEFFNLPEVSKLNLNNGQKESFVVDSEYFTLKASTEFNQSYFFLNSILAVDDSNNITVISRKIGRY